MQQIDFLPASYRLDRQRRQKRLWRRYLLAVFLSLIIAGTVGQRQSIVRLRAQRDEVNRHADEMTAQLQSPQQLRDQITRLDARANLLATLRLRVPATRLLAAVTATLPRFVSLTELHSSRETVDMGVSSGPRQRSRNSKTAPDALPAIPEQAELDNLHQLAQRERLFVTLSGLAPDDLALSRYLAALEATQVFDEVRLVFTGSHILGEHALRRFEIRLRVKRPRLGAGRGEGAADNHVARHGAERRDS